MLLNLPLWGSVFSSRDNFKFARVTFTRATSTAIFAGTLSRYGNYTSAPLARHLSGQPIPTECRCHLRRQTLWDCGSTTSAGACAQSLQRKCEAPLSICSNQFQPRSIHVPRAYALLLIHAVHQVCDTVPQLQIQMRHHDCPTPNSGPLKRGFRPWLQRSSSQAVHSESTTLPVHATILMRALSSRSTNSISRLIDISSPQCKSLRWSLRSPPNASTCHPFARTLVSPMWSEVRGEGRRVRRPRQIQRRFPRA